MNNNQKEKLKVLYKNKGENGMKYVKIYQNTVILPPVPRIMFLGMYMVIWM